LRDPGTEDIAEFRSQLLAWFSSYRRELPWREGRDPYLIWLSEIMLQQTRVSQMLPYFERFTRLFPDVHALANASRNDVLMAWEGLGYYSRARNRHDAARKISEAGGDFPDTYEGLLALKGVGPYTAAAVSSIAFGKPHAVVDGNVIRVVSRLSGFEDDVSTGPAKRFIQELADQLIDPVQPGDFNQAMMELGSLVCKPVNPHCGECPVQPFCVAAKTARTDTIPYKAPGKKVPHHQIVAGVCRDEDNRLLIALRPEDKMLGGLWEFPGGKVEPGETQEEALIRELSEELGVMVSVGEKITEIRHAYSHFKITMHAYECRIVPGEPEPEPKASKMVKWIYPHQLADYPFPKANRKLTEMLVP
jgi:A/G-specific adenine glycosylase